MKLKSSDGASFFIMTYGAIKLTGVRECNSGGNKSAQKARPRFRA